MEQQALPKHYLELIQEAATKPKNDPNLSTDHQDYDPVATVDEQLNKLCLSDDDEVPDLLPNASSENLKDATHTSAVDKSSHTLTALDYYCASSKPDTLTDKSLSIDLDYMLEVYGFRPSLKTRDLLKELHTYGSTNVRLKWVDDTHAIAVYKNSADALLASKGRYFFIKVKSLSRSDHVDSLAIAKQYGESIRDSLNEVTPHKQKSRPATTSTVARRMVGHALGIKINVSPEQNRLEKQKIENVKEEKRRTKLRT